MYDIAIIGCGIVGAAVAYELSKYQLSIVVLEKENDVAMGATRANSAILHAGYDPKPGTLMARLNVEGVSLAREICAALDVPIRVCGSLVLAFTQEEEQTLDRLYAQGLSNGVLDLKLLSAQQARMLEPNIDASVTAALLAPTAAIVNPWEYALAMAETAVRNGAEIKLNCGVTGISRDGNGFTIQTAGGPFSARRIINCAGVNSAAIQQLIGRQEFTIRPSRGQYYLFDKSEGNRVSHVIFQCPTRAGKGVLVAPTVHGNLLAGPNAEEIADGADTSTTAEGLAFVSRLARRSVPSLEFGASIRNFAGVRAVSDREDFIIEESASVPGLINLAGIKSPGLSAAPAIAKYAVGLLESSGLSLIPKTQLVNSRRRIRFHALPAPQKAALVRENPLYGRVVCRCETITEGEILDAIHSPIPPVSIDGVKRRVGAGLGRCQGGFCSPRVLQILSHALDLPPEQILQDGEGSQILLDRL